MDHDLTRARRRSIALVCIIWIGANLLVLALWQFVRKLDNELMQQRFQRQVDDVQKSISERMKAYELLLRNGSGLFMVSDNITRGEWKSFIAGLNLDVDYPGLLGMGYAKYISPDQVRTLEQSIRAEGFPDYKVWPKDLHTPYYPITLLEPVNERNRRALGYNMFSEPRRRAAMELARDTGKPSLSAPVILVQETEQDVQAGVLFYSSVYQGESEPGTVEERKNRLIGYVYAPFRMGDLMQGILQERFSQFDLAITDALAEPGENKLYGNAPKTKPMMQFERDIPLGGRVWRLIVSSTPEQEAALRKSTRSDFWLWIGVVLACLLAVSSGMVYMRRQSQRFFADNVARELQRREERFRQLIEHAPIGMLMVDARGRIELVNEQAERLFGYPRSELEGQPVELLLPERFRTSHQAFRGHYQRSPEARQMGIGRDLFARRKDGTEVPVEIGLNPITTDTGVKTLSSIIDLTERRRAEERFRLLVEAAPFAIVLVNRDGIIELVNVQTERLFGYTRSELLGQPIELLVPDAVSGRHHSLRDDYLRDPSQRRMGGNRELFGRHKTGREIPVEVGLAPIRTGDSVLIKAAILDISERKASEKKLKEQAEQLAIANRYKSEFLANMSHELRTPLNSILILSEQLQENRGGNLSPKQIMHADIIHRSGSDLLHLINDILDLSKIEAGRMTLLIEPVNLRDLIAEIDANVRPQMEAKVLEFHTSVADDVPLTLATDHHRLYQVLKNLLSNAIKFTDTGSVSLSVIVQNNALPAGWKDDAALIFVVRDTGIGIPADRLEMIFHAFQQVEASLSRRYGGTGLGLAISRQLVGLLEGEINVESVEGVGSIFSVWLPLNRTPEMTDIDLTQRLFKGKQPIEIDNVDPEGMTVTQFKGRRVLLVDDDVRNVYAMSAMLDRFNLAIDVAHNGLEALCLLKTQQVDIILMDISMPLMDGYTAIRILKQEHQFTTPIIALTANAMKGDREKCLEAGADDYVAKPVTLQVMQEVLSKWLL